MLDQIFSWFYYNKNYMERKLRFFSPTKLPISEIWSILMNKATKITNMTTESWKVKCLKNYIYFVLDGIMTFEF